ncbi:hypothetical protein [Streptomyces sp. NPDC048825]|uniref:hypothetical protein n=1 Tax=Streptomyces sp. NPDC048825 TaxID=3365592 RepID=UPI003722F297
MSGNHARRITEALKTAPDPTPQQVRETLHCLGYIDERLDGPQRSGKTVEFTVDLRILGGKCLSGSTTGTKTVLEPYGAIASDDVRCLDVQRRS